MLKKRRFFRKRGCGFLGWILTAFILIIAMAAGWNIFYSKCFLKIEYPRKYSSYVEKYSSEYGVDSDLVYAVIHRESNFNPKAKSGVGAVGLMQITPPTFEWALQKTNGVEAGIKSYNISDLYDPETNIKYGTYILSELIAKFGDRKTAIAAYNAGPGNVKKWLLDVRYSKDGRTLYKIPFRETSAYVNKVDYSYVMYRKIYDGKS